MPVGFSATTQALARGGRVVSVRGDVDLYAASELKRVLRDAVANGDGRLVIDLTETSSLDSTALAALLVARRRALLLGGRVVLVNTDPHIAETLQMTGLDGILDVATDVEAALRLVAS